MAIRVGMPTPQQSMANRVGGRPRRNRAWQTMWGTPAPQQSMANRVGDAHHNGAWQSVWGVPHHNRAWHSMSGDAHTATEHGKPCRGPPAPQQSMANRVGGCPHHNFAWKTVRGCTRRYRAVGIGVVIFHALCDGRPLSPASSRTQFATSNALATAKGRRQKNWPRSVWGSEM